MGFFKNIFGARSRDRPKNQSAGGREARRVRGARLGLRSIFKWSTAEQALGNSEIYYAGVSRIANTMGMLPCRLYEGRQRVDDNQQANRLMLRPNRRQSWINFMKASEIWRNTEGRSFWLKLVDPITLEVQELVILDPTRVSTWEDPESGNLYYEIIRPYSNIVDRVSAWYVLFFPHMSTDGVEGVRVIDVLAGTVEYDRKIKEYSEKQLAGVTRGIVLEFPTEMDEEKRTAAVDEFVRVYQESNGTVMALDAGEKATQFSLSPVDAQVLAVEGITRTRIATVLNMPPHLLGDTSGGVKTVEQSTLDFLTSTIVAAVTMYEQEMDWRLLTPEQRDKGWHWRFEVEAMLRADTTTKSTYYFQAVRTGYMTLNEVREREYLPPVQGGEVPLVSKDLAPLDFVLGGGTMGLPVGGAPTGGGNNG